MTDRTYVFRLTGDFQQLDQSAAKAGASVEKLAGTTDGVAKGMAAAGNTGDRFAQKTLPGITASGKLTAQQLTQVGYQLNDFAVQVASGQSPFLALVQQGSQLSGTFGGVGNATRALLSLLTPARLAVGVLGAGFVALATAAVQGYTANLQFERSLLLTGNRAGTTASEIDALTKSIAASTNTTVGSTRATLQALVSTGQIGPQALAPAATAVQLLSKRTGQSADEIVKGFARMGDGVARYAVEQNKSFNFLTAANVRYIRQLEAQGKSQEAQAEYFRLLSAQLGRQLPSDMGLLETAWTKVRNAASSAWDAMLNIGKPDTLSQQIERATDDLAFAEKRLAETQGQRFKFKPDLDGKRVAAETARTRLETLREQQRAEGRAAEEQAAQAARNQREITDNERGAVDARLSLQRAGQAQQQAASDLGRQTELQAVERQYELLQISSQRYVSQRAAIEQRGIDARLAAVSAEVALEKQRQPENPAEATAQAARLIELETRRYAILADRLKLEEQVRQNFNVRPRDVSEDPQSAFRQAEIAQNEAIAQGYRDRNIAARQAAVELRTTNRALAIDLIKDDRARGLATIAAEEVELRKRLDLYALNAEERKAVEDDIAAYVAARNAQLTEQLKPQWQRMLEGWSDTQRLMRETSDEFQTEFLRSSEDTWVEFVKTGKLSFQKLGDLLLETLARYQFQSQVGQYAGVLGSAIAGFFGGGGATNGLGGQNYGGQVVNNPSGYVGGAATGTNFVERDMLTILHKGEAVVPAKFNPAAFGGGLAAMPPVTVNMIGGQQPDKVEAKQDATGGLSINLIYRQFADRLNAETAQGYGVAPGVQARFGGSGAANLGT